MKEKVRLITSVVVIGVLLGLTGAAWAAEPTEAQGLRGQVMAIEGNTLLVATVRGRSIR